jgi:hypothetical protein
MDEVETVLKVLLGIAVLVAHLYNVASKARAAAPRPDAPPKKAPKPPKPQKPRAAPLPPADRGARARPPAVTGGAAAAAAKRADEARRKALARIERLNRAAAELAGAARVERANRRFVEALAGYLPRELARARDAVSRGGDARGAGAIADEAETVMVEIQSLMRQRRDPGLLPELGDADAFADACYAPIMDFAKAEGLPLRSSAPATQLTDFDLSIWTGFIRTSIAPIFLPADFFSTALRWPALAHEIGHDFLASVEGLEGNLRRELGLPSADAGARPLPFGAGGLDASDLGRVFGAWFEEIFCDVFGTLMCGPAYVVTMSECFASRLDPRRILIVFPDQTGSRYDTHPPAHLRVLVGCAVLERAGFTDDARSLQEAWARRHGGGAYPLDRLLFPIGRQLAALPLGFFADIARALVERLYAGPLKALSGFGLQDVSGLDYGPHEHMESLRARDALLGGRIPGVRDPRAILAGAVLAAAQRPELEPRILAAARAAIPAAGTGEARPDAFTIGGDPAGRAGPIETDRRAVLEALVLREILGPPKALRGSRARRAGL